MSTAARQNSREAVLTRTPQFGRPLHLGRCTRPTPLCPPPLARHEIITSDPQTGMVSEVRAVVHYPRHLTSPADSPGPVRRQAASRKEAARLCEQIAQLSKQLAALEHRLERLEITRNRCRPHTYRYILTRLRGRRTQPTSQGHPRKPGNRHREPPRQRRPGQAQKPREPRHPHRPRIRLVQHHRAPTHWRCCSAIHSQTCVPSMLGSLRAT